jgi:hypothetical protein
LFAVYPEGEMLFMDFRRHHTGVWDGAASRVKARVLKTCILRDLNLMQMKNDQCRAFGLCSRARSGTVNLEEFESNVNEE